MARGAAFATLSTAGPGGQPSASLVTHALAPDGAALLWLSTLSEHTRHLSAEPRCALLFLGEAAGENPQERPRATMTGLAVPSGAPSLKALWLARHPYAAPYADFADFALWRVEPRGGLLVAGFGRAARLRAADWAPASGEAG